MAREGKGGKSSAELRREATVSINLRYAASQFAQGGLDGLKNGFALWDKIAGPTAR